MRPKTAGTRARPTVLTALSALLLATACTSGDGKEPAKGSDTPASSGATTGAGKADGGRGSSDGGDSGTGNGGAAGGDTSKPLSSPQLERSALATGDLPGFQVSTGKSALAPAGQPAADTPTCQPLADAMGDAPSPRAKSTVNRGLGSVKSVGLAVSASVSAYSEADAVRLMDGLKKAVGACGKGFTATLQGRSGSYREVKESPLHRRGRRRDRQLDSGRDQRGRGHPGPSGRGAPRCHGGAVHGARPRAAGTAARPPGGCRQAAGEGRPGAGRLSRQVFYQAVVAVFSAGRNSHSAR